MRGSSDLLLGLGSGVRGFSELCLSKQKGMNFGGVLPWKKSINAIEIFRNYFSKLKKNVLTRVQRWKQEAFCEQYLVMIKLN